MADLGCPDRDQPQDPRSLNYLLYAALYRRGWLAHLRGGRLAGGLVKEQASYFAGPLWFKQQTPTISVSVA